jgi:hypothetical protein
MVKIQLGRKTLELFLLEKASNFKRDGEILKYCISPSLFYYPYNLTSIVHLSIVSNPNL